MILRTNSKEFRKRFEQYFIDCINSDDFESENIDDCLKYFWQEFDRVSNYPYNKQCHPVLQDRVADYLAGLPFGFAFDWQGIKDAGIRLGTVDENTPDEKIDKYIYTWFGFLACKIIQLSEKHNINVFKYA